MPKTPRTISSAPSIISKPPVLDIPTPVSASVSAPVLASDSAFASSSAPIIMSSALPAGLATNDSLPRGQFDRDLFEKFTLFMEWEKSAHHPSIGASSLSSLSSVHSVSVPSSRPIYSLAPSALSSPIIPPSSGLGSLRSSTTLASSRGTEAHVLPGRGAAISSRATRLTSSVAHSGTGQSVSGGRFGVSLPRGAFGGRDTTAASGDSSLADYYLEDLDYDHLGRSQFPLGLQQPPVSSVWSVDLDYVSDDFEPDDFTGSSPYSRSVQAETLLCRYLGDLYRVNRESSGADSQSGGRSSARLYLFTDASLTNNSGIKLPLVFASEFTHLDSLPVLHAVPQGADISFCFDEEDQSRFFSPQSLAADTEAFGRSLKAPLPNSLQSKVYRSQDKGWRFVAEASDFAARLAAFSTALLDLLIRADELEVSEEDRVSIRAILIDLSALNFSQAARIKLHATTRRRHLALDSLSLLKDFNGQAVDRISRVGLQVFGGKFLEAVDSDLSMNKRAKEVADRLRPRQSVFHSFCRGRSSFFPSSGRRGFRSRAGGRSRISLSRYRGGFRSSLTRPNPPPPLNPPSDCMVGIPVNPAPVGGRLSLFVAQWQTITRDHSIISVVAQGFQISVQDNFPGVLREVTVPPRDPKAHLAICKEIQELIFFLCNRPNRRFSFVMPFSDFCYSQKDGIFALF